MIYRFLIVSDEVDDFMREIKIDPEATFLDFHNAIIKSCNYEDEKLASFTICEDGWDHGQMITREEMETDPDKDSYTMEDTRLSDFLEDEKQQLLYTFDPLGGRSFFIQLTEIITGKSVAEPTVSRKKGTPPEQTIDYDALFAKDPITAANASLDLDDDFSEGISDEDIDLEGLDISDNPFGDL